MKASLTVQIYESEGEARVFEGNFICDIRPSDGGAVTRVSIGNFLDSLGLIKNTRWHATSWGWQAEFIKAADLVQTSHAPK